MSRRKRILTAGICGAVLAVALVWLIVVTFLRPRAILRDRVQQAESIAVACGLYAADHAGQFPERLQDLIPDYIPDAQYLVFTAPDSDHLLDCQYFGSTLHGPSPSVLIRVPSHGDDGPSVIVRADQTSSVEKSR